MTMKSQILQETLHQTPNTNNSAKI